MRDYGLLIKNAREAQGLTQEQAAEDTGVSVDSWYAYEANKRLPNRSTVGRMTVVLDAPWLALEYLDVMSGGLGVLPELQARELPTAVLTLLDRVLEFNEKCRARQLMSIAQDGVIDEGEQVIYEQIVSDLDGIIEAALAVKYPKWQKKNRLDAGTSKRIKVSGQAENNRKNIVTHLTGKSRANFVKEGGAFL